MSPAAERRLRGFAGLGDALAAPKLRAVMVLLFVSLSIPVLLVILAYNYHRMSGVIITTLHEQVAKTRLATIENAQNMVQPVASTVQLLAEVAASNPPLFKAEPSRELLYRALISADQIDAIYLSFEDGYHRVVTRMDERRRRSDPRIPSTANWHSSYIDAYAAGKNRLRHRTFFDTWPHVVGGYDVPGTTGPWGTPHYQAAKPTGALVVTDLGINPDTGAPVLFVAFPILREGRFLGFACANITVDILSQFLGRHGASPHSTTAIVERGGTIIAYPDSAKQVRLVDGRLRVARVADIADDDLREAYRQRAQFRGDNFEFRSPATGQEMSAAFDRFPEGFPRPWETVILTPTDDFVGPLKATSRQIVIIIAV